MKQNNDKSGQGARLAELLKLQFADQYEAAGFLGMSQPQLSQQTRREWLSSFFWRKYAPKLAKVGLNAGYITDPDNNAPMFEEAAEAYLAKIREKLKLQKTA